MRFVRSSNQIVAFDLTASGNGKNIPDKTPIALEPSHTNIVEYCLI